LPKYRKLSFASVVCTQRLQLLFSLLVKRSIFRYFIEFIKRSNGKVNRFSSKVSFLQTSLIALLILWYTGNTTLTLLFSAVYGAVVFAITHPSGWISAEVLWYGQVNIIFIQQKYSESDTHFSLPFSPSTSG
jgi:hypothetical protein